MHEHEEHAWKIINYLYDYANRNGLIFTPNFNKESRTYSFRFQDQARTWGYSRLMPEELLDDCAGDYKDLADCVIRDLESKVSEVSSR